LEVCSTEAAKGPAARQKHGLLISAIPKFSALSYVWGGPSETHVLCNGIQINVTDNCYDALSSLWRLHGPLLIWVDAICINQSDEKEKSAQIGLMHDNYLFFCTTSLYLVRRQSGGTRTEAVDLLDEVSLLEMPLLETVLDYPGGGWRERQWGKSRQLVRMVASDLRYVLRSKSFCPCSPVLVPFFSPPYTMLLHRWLADTEEPIFEDPDKMALGRKSGAMRRSGFSGEQARTGWHTILLGGHMFALYGLTTGDDAL